MQINSILIIGLLFLILLIAATVRKSFGFGDSILATPILIIFFDQLNIITPLISLTTLLLGVIIIITDGSALKLNKDVVKFFLYSVIGIIVGSFFLKESFHFYLKLILTIFVIVIALQNLFGNNLKLFSNKIFKFLLGLFSGFFSITFNMAGPTTAIYFSKYDKKAFKATVSLYFILIEPITTYGHYQIGLINKKILILFFLIGIPACLIGVLLSGFIDKWFKFSKEKFQKRVYQLLILTSLIVIIQLSGLFKNVESELFSLNDLNKFIDLSSLTYLGIGVFNLIILYLIMLQNRIKL